ncbi:MAG: DUF962 domain-containing protein [Gammaproteobacteria bacterium]|nr:DUF962 domain-containing protein [Gammaproteobacteria bacterium]
MQNKSGPFKSFAQFYPFYLDEHRHPLNRLLHFIGSSAIILVVFAVLITEKWWGLMALPVIGYGFAWVGHFIFEKNKPATFKYPFYSLLGDWVMFKDIVIKRVKIKN